MTILEEAAAIVDGDREKSYGHPSINFERTAILWSVVLGHPVSLEQVALMMVCLKIARQVHTSGRDNLVDAVGYLACIDKMVRAGCNVTAPVDGSMQFAPPTYHTLENEA